MWTRMTRMHHNPPSAPSPARRARCDRRERQRTDARRRRIRRIQRARDRIVQPSTRRSLFARRVVRTRREFASEGSRSTRRVSFRCRPLTLDSTRFVSLSPPHPNGAPMFFFAARGWCSARFVVAPSPPPGAPTGFAARGWCGDGRRGRVIRTAAAHHDGHNTRRRRRRPQRDRRALLVRRHGAAGGQMVG